MGKIFYITTPLYYVNSPLTVGGAYTTIVADVIARYQRGKGKEVFFLTGSDEHGQKIQRAAAARGVSPAELADGVVGTFLELWKLLDISNDDFIRTSEKRHEDTVRRIFLKLKENGDIYPGRYEGWYCTPCETYLAEGDLSEGNCPQCGRPVEKLREENFFFRFSRYQDQLNEHFQAHPDFVLPSTRFREMTNRLREGVKDISISRSVGWGIPVPGREEQGIWVWFDALINYLSAVGYGDPDAEFARVWPPDLQLMAKDIVWFHSLLWPAMLLALDLPLPRRIYAHGWWTMGGKKISKSGKEKIFAREMAEEWGADALRYFLLREVPLGQDGDFSRIALAGRYRSDLAHDLGNLIQRTLTMVKKFRGGRLPAPAAGPVDPLLDDFRPRYGRMMEDYRLSQVLEEIWKLVRWGNRYIEESKPWKLNKDPSQGRELDRVLSGLISLLLRLAGALSPFMPETAREMIRQINPELAGPPEFDEAARERLSAGRVSDKIKPLFPLAER